MLELTASSGPIRRAILLLAFSIMAVGAVMAMGGDAFGSLLIVFAAGGAIGGLLMMTFVRHSDPLPPISAPDSFQRDDLRLQIIDVSRIRVAGFGGLGLMAMAIALGFTIPRIGVSLALGLVGGFLISFAIASYRRHHAGRWS